MSTALLVWIDAISALFVAIAGLAALVGSLGLLRFGHIFQRAHATTLGTTMGTWGMTTATVLQVSFASGQLYVHALLIALFIALTAPVTAIFLMRASLFRARMRGDTGIPLGKMVPKAAENASEPG